MNKYIFAYKRKIDFKRTIKNIIEICFFNFFKTFFLRKKVLFISFGGKQYSDNPKAISEYLHKLDPSLKIVWLFNNPKELKFPSYVKAKKNNKINLYYQLATSKVWVDNDYLVYLKQLLFLKKNKKQLYIQTWHGDKGIKRSFYAYKGYRRSIPFALEREGMCDYLVTGSLFGETVLKKTFNYRGCLLKTGMPKNDCLINPVESDIRDIKKRLNIGENVKILTYAPTFRQYNLIEGVDVERINFKRLVETLEKKTKSKWVVVYRLHHHKTSLVETSGNFINGNTNFQDMSELMQITDLLITDYSSCFADFALSGKLSILYIPDLNKYSELDRGLLVDLKASPFLIAYNNDQLNSIINKFDFTKTRSYCSKINDFFGNYEIGDASKKISELILEKIKQ